MPVTILQSEFDCLSYFTLWTFPRPVKMHQLITKLHNSGDSKLQKAISPMGMLPHSVWEFGWYQSERFLRWICFCLVQHTAVTCNRFDVNRKKAFHSTLLETYGSHTYKTLIIFKVFFWFHQVSYYPPTQSQWVASALHLRVLQPWTKNKIA